MELIYMRGNHMAIIGKNIFSSRFSSFFMGHLVLLLLYTSVIEAKIDHLKLNQSPNFDQLLEAGKGGQANKVVKKCERHLGLVPFSITVHEDIPSELRYQYMQLIREFLGPQRYFDTVLGLRHKDSGQLLQADQQIVLDVEGHPLLLFHRMQRDAYSTHYAGIWGVGIVVVEVLMKSAFTEENLAKRLHHGELLPIYLSQLNQERSPLFFDISFPISIINEEDRIYFIRSYEPGPTFYELEQMAKTGRINKNIWHEAEKSYQTFVAKLERLEKDPTFRKFTQDRNLYIKFMLKDTDVVYSNGQWKLIWY